ncbi:MAG: Gfo/Idh/MocA family oxidoreductase [Elusimicrobia bacterium]|nr:Gfo/Idh/MocA family oxidoreductase [Elusimicrobiota bacterium]
MSQQDVVLANHQTQEVKPVRYGVIGLGRMGALHLQNLKEMAPKVALAAIVDNDFKRLRRAKKLYPQAKAFRNYKELLGKVDAVSICTPTDSHCQIAEFFLEKKVPSLVEKPIASNLTEAEKMLWASQEYATHLHIGHVERFNPAVVKAKEFIKQPVFIEAVRFGPYEPRVHDIGVILDIMIHDLDLVLWMLSDLNVELEEVGGQGLSVLSPHEDLAKVRLKFREKVSGHPVIVDLTANRLTMEKIRRIRIFQEDSYLSLDLLNHKLRHSRAKQAPIKDLKDIVTSYPRLSAANPLRQELEHFITSVAQNDAHDIHPREAWDALELALRLAHTIERKNLYNGQNANASTHEPALH